MISDNIRQAHQARQARKKKLRYILSSIAKCFETIVLYTIYEK